MFCGGALLPWWAQNATARWVMQGIYRLLRCFSVIRAQAGSSWVGSSICCGFWKCSHATTKCGGKPPRGPWFRRVSAPRGCSFRSPGDLETHLVVVSFPRQPLAVYAAAGDIQTGKSVSLKCGRPKLETAGFSRQLLEYNMIKCYDNHFYNNTFASNL